MMIRENHPKAEWERIIGQMPADTVIGEMAGRDSVAAILKVMEQDGVDQVLPVVTFAPVEYGETLVMEENHKLLCRQVRDRFGGKKEMGPLLYDSNQALWQVLNGVYTSEIQQRYGFYTPCIACHAYVHLMRMPIARKLGRIVISGERESHDGRVKANQLGICLDSYQRILRHFDVELLIPLRHMKDGKEVEDLIGWEWAEGKAQPQCLFSGNDRDARGQSLIEESQIPAFLSGFLEPMCRTLGSLLLENPDADLQEMKKAVNLLNQGEEIR